MILTRTLKILPILFCLSLSLQLNASETRKKILIATGSGSWPPLEMTAEDGSKSGLHIDMVQEVAKSLQIDVTFKNYPWKRAINMLKMGEAHAVTYMSWTEDREQFGYFFDGNILSSSQIAFFTLKENLDDIPYNGELKSISHLIIGTLTGYSYSEGFDNATFLKIDDSSAYESELVIKLIRKRVPIAIGNIADIQYVAKQLGVQDRIAFLKPYVDKAQANYIVFSKISVDQSLAKSFSAEMEKFKKSDDYIKLLDKYGLSMQ